MNDLREYQEDAVSKAGVCFKYSKKVILTMPTGSGKTRCGSVIAIRSSKKGNLVDILVHREETMQQFIKTLKLLGHDPEVCSADKRITNWDAPIIVAMVETYHRRKGERNRNTGLIIVDEAHRGEFRKVIAEYEGKVLGLTATPMAASAASPLSEYFDACVDPIKASWLIDNGYLCRPEYYVPQFYGKRLVTVRGEFSESSQLSEFLSPKLFKGALKQYMSIAGGEKAICYNVNIEHSLRMLEEFTNAGIKCWHVDGETSKDARKKIFDEFSKYEGACVLHNVGVATTGTDIPSVTTIILNRATTQFALYHQMVGRGSRPVEGVKTTFKVIDMGGNSPRFKNLGVYGQDVDWKFLFANPNGEYDGRSPRTMKKACPKCAKVISIRTTKCECCGYVYPKELALKEAEMSKDLSIMRDVAKAYMPDSLKKPTSMMSYKELVVYGSYMGYKSNWPGLQMKHRKEAEKRRRREEEEKQKQLKQGILRFPSSR